MILEIKIKIKKTYNKNKKLITTEFKKALVELIEHYFKHDWKNISYNERDD